MAGYALPMERLQPLLDAMAASGGRWETKRICSFLGSHPKNLSARLAHAVEAGKLHRLHEGRCWWYALGPAPAPEDPGPSTPDRVSAVDPIEDGDDVIDCGENFAASLWSDGELMLRGIECRDGGQLVLTRPQVRVLRSLLTGEIAL